VTGDQFEERYHDALRELHNVRVIYTALDLLLDEPETRALPRRHQNVIREIEHFLFDLRSEWERELFDAEYEWILAQEEDEP
jgi:hypothetical protein